jgi:hypothetical protein
MPSLNTKLATAPNTSSNYVLKATTSTTIGNSLIWDNGTNVGIGNTNTTYTFDVTGTGRTTTGTYLATSSGSVGIGTTSPYAIATGRNVTIEDSTNNDIALTFGLAGTRTGQIYTSGLQFRLSAVTNIPMLFFTNDTERMRITSTGNVGIGTTSANAKFQVAADGAYVSNWDAAQLWVTGTDTAKRLQIGYDTTNGYGIIQAIHGGVSVKNLLLNPQGGLVAIGTTTNLGGGNLEVQSNGVSSYTARSTSSTGANGGTTVVAMRGVDSSASYWANAQYNAWQQIFCTNGSDERMRITSGGIIIIGTPSANNSSTNLQVEGTASFGQMTLRYANAASGRHWRVGPDGANNFVIYNENNIGAYIGYSATSWTGNSDIRLKNIINPITDAVSKLSTLNPIVFSWKADETNKENLGLIAQDVEKVFPQIIDTNSEGMLGVRYTELIPVLVKAIQELSAKVEALENKS